MKKGLITFLSICLLLLVWQLMALYVGQPELIPSVPRLAETLFQLLRTAAFYQHISATILRGLAGMLISLACAFVSASLFARCRLVYELCRPLLPIMRSVPVISFILLALIFLKPEGIPPIIAFLTMYPLLTENITEGLLNLRPGLSLMADLFKLNGRNRLLQVVYPQLKPFLFSGLASAAGFGWRAIIMGEVLSQCAFGIGGEMKRAQNFIAVPELVAWTIMAVLISFLFDKGIGKLASVRWRVSFCAVDKDIKEYKGPVSPVGISDVTFRYTGTEVLSHFSYTFKPGIIYGIKAPSGTGKTTLLNLIGGSLKPAEGKIEYKGKQNFSAVFQEPELLSHLTVTENISLSLASAYNQTSANRLSLEALEYVEMEAFANKYPDELSYGQQQRVALARALAYPSNIMLLDEPFKGLDKALTFRIIGRILSRQAERKQTIIFSSHDPEELALLASVVIEMPQVSLPSPDYREGKTRK